MYKILIYLYNFLPKGIRKYITKKTTYYLVNKYADLKVINFQNVPENEPFIFIGNHLSNLDGLLLSKLFEEKNKKVLFLAGVKLKGEAVTRAVLEIVPHIEIEPNKPDRKALKNAVKALKDGSSILIFPEGTRSRTGEMLKGRSGVYLIAKMSGAKIIPVAIAGSEKCLPVETSGKMSKESFVHSEVTVTFGEGFYVQELPESQEPIDEMMKKIAELLPFEYRGYYK